MSLTLSTLIKAAAVKIGKPTWHRKNGTYSGLGTRDFHQHGSTAGFLRHSVVYTDLSGLRHDLHVPALGYPGVVTSELVKI